MPAHVWPEARQALRFCDLTGSAMTAIRVLLVAEAANPEWVSVPLVGWSLARALMDRCDAHLVTQVRNREAIENTGMNAGSDFTALDTESVDGFAWRAANVLRMGAGRGWTTMAAISALTYPNFERKLCRVFKDAIQSGKYEVVHRITPLSPTINGPLARFCQNAGVPFVVGPLNGGLPWPKGFEQERIQEREWLSYVRNTYKLLPYRYQTLRSATAIISGSRHTQCEIPEAFRDKSFLIPENAIDPKKFPRRMEEGRIRAPLRACFIGRLVPYKGVHLLLSAAASLLREGRLTLDVIGSGPQENELRSLSQRLGIGQAVTFHGWVEHGEVKSILGACDILPFPSVREFGGGVVLEAMAMGVVPIVIDYGGPGELVDERTGIKIPIGNREAIEDDLRRAIEELASSPEKLETMGRRARERVNNCFTWQRKAEQIVEIYEWCRGMRTERPRFDLISPPATDPAVAAASPQ